MPALLKQGNPHDWKLYKHVFMSLIHVDFIRRNLY